jgi:hypothetical protein
MNCLEFHREKLAEPRALSREAQAHAAQCAACREFAQGVDEAERELEQAIAVPVPEGLADRVLLRVRGGRPAWKTWALAASILVAVALGFAAVTLHSPAGDQYARLAIEHVALEPESFTTLHGADTQALGEMIRTSGGGRLKAPLGNIRYVKLCPVDSGTGWHIVFETPEGLATLLIVPGKPPAALQRASSGEWSALVRPTRAGYYAVVMPSAGKTAQVDRLVRERIDWDA